MFLLGQPGAVTTEDFKVDEKDESIVWCDVSAPFNKCAVRVRLMMEGSGGKGEACVGVAQVPLAALLAKQELALAGTLDPLGSLIFDADTDGLAGSGKVLPRSPRGGFLKGGRRSGIHEQDKEDRDTPVAEGRSYLFNEENPIRADKGEIQDWLELRPVGELAPPPTPATPAAPGGAPPTPSGVSSTPGRTAFGGFDFPKRRASSLARAAEGRTLAVQMRVLVAPPERRVKSYKRVMNERQQEMERKQKEAKEVASTTTKQKSLSGESVPSTTPKGAKKASGASFDSAGSIELTDSSMWSKLRANRKKAVTSGGGLAPPPAAEPPQAPTRRGSLPPVRREKESAGE